jgi:hypothetical protein
MSPKSMKVIKLIILLVFFTGLQISYAQDPEVAFHAGARAYIGGDVATAKKIVSDALRFNPSDPKLNELLSKLREQEKQNQQQQQQQQEKKDQENKEQGEKTDQEDDDQQKSDQKPENAELDNRERQNEDPQEEQEMDIDAQPQRVDNPKISKERAMMILEAMRNNEIQYIQQQRKKPQQRQPDDMPSW